MNYYPVWLLAILPIAVYWPFAKPAPEYRDPIIRDQQPRHGNAGESSPFVWRGQLYVVLTRHPNLHIEEYRTGKLIATIPGDRWYPSVLAEGEQVHIYCTDKNRGSKLFHYSSFDLKDWKRRDDGFTPPGGTQLFNTSVCRVGDRYVMAYESAEPHEFVTRFAASNNNHYFSPVDGAALGLDGQAMCPTLRYFHGWYYCLYLEERTPREWYFVTRIARSRDLIHWEKAARPALQPRTGEGVNASDIDMCEFEGTTYFCYLVGDQKTWLKLRYGHYPGSEQAFCESFFI